MKQLLSALSSLPKLSDFRRRTQPSDSHSSLRVIRLRARTPRLLLGALVLVLCMVGVRSMLGGRSASAAPVVTGEGYDLGAAAFAQSFASTYLTWGPNASEGERELALKPFLAQGIEADGGLAPAPHSAESVTGTQVAEESHAGSIIDVLVVAQTSEGTQYVSVPVERGERGLLFIASYPALVGPPATLTSEPSLAPEPVEDRGLEAVVSRALRNYLTGQAANLRADLTGGAVVSLPTQPLEVTEIDSAGWLVAKHTVAARVTVKNQQGTRLTLSYQVGVVRRGRWYIDSIQDDPTLKGGM